MHEFPHLLPVLQTGGDFFGFDGAFGAFFFGAFFFGAASTVETAEDSKTMEGMDERETAIPISTEMIVFLFMLASYYYSTKSC